MLKLRKSWQTLPCLLLLWFGNPKADLSANCHTTFQPRVRRDVLDNVRLDTPYDDDDQSKVITVWIHPDKWSDRPPHAITTDGLKIFISRGLKK